MTQFSANSVKANSLCGTRPRQILTNDLYGAPNIRRHQTTTAKQRQRGSIP
jgi:hypothetical protein